MGGRRSLRLSSLGRGRWLGLRTRKSRGARDWLAATTSNEQVRIEPAVMASEIERLADLTGYLKLASQPDWMGVKLTAQTSMARPRRPRQPSPQAQKTSPVDAASAPVQGPDLAPTVQSAATYAPRRKRSAVQAASKTKRKPTVGKRTPDRSNDSDHPKPDGNRSGDGDLRS